MNDWFELQAADSSDAIGIVTEEGRLLFANKSFYNLADKSVHLEEVSTIYDLDLPVDLKFELERAIKTAGGNCQEDTFDCEFGRGDQQRRYQCRVIPNLRSKDMSLLLEIRDKSDICRLQNELFEGKLSRQQEKLLKDRRRRLFFGLLDDLPTFVYLQRKDYTVAFANKKVRMLYGESEGKLCYEVFAGRNSPCPVCPTFEVFDTGQSVEWEFTDNDNRTFLIYDYPYEDEDGESLVLEMGVDITELKNVEKELYKAQKLRAIGVLAGGIAHDLNNNLVPIIFSIEYAKGKVTEEEVLEPLGDALQAANRAARLVAQVLEYSRQQDVSRTTIRLVPIIRECVRDIENSLPAGVSLQVTHNLEADCVFANAAQIQQVIMNLIRNAEQSMPEGGVISINLGEKVVPEIRDNGYTKLDPGRYIVLDVSDNGIGIRPENMERIFEPFFTSKKSSGGTGMGLAVVHSIITGNGGDIKVASTPGIGSTFTVYLPSVVESQEMLQGELCVLDGDNIHILLVDDDPGPLKAMSRSLKESGFMVDTAGSGEEGLELFRSNPDQYSLVIADQSMPGMTGLQMSEKILAVNSDAKIVICTGHIEPALEEQAKHEGVAGFARKPMSPKTLTEIVRQHCRYK